MERTSPFLSVSADEHLASNALAFALFDAFPVTAGHTLIVPRRLVATWFEATRDEQVAMLDLVDAVKSLLDARFHPDGYNVGFNAGAAAGQTVAHLHLHVIPRYEGDMDDPRGGVRHVIPSRGNYLRPTASHALSAGGTRDPFHRHLAPLFARATDITIVAAFVQDGGVRLLGPLLFDADASPAHVRLLTGDYLHITQASALEALLDWTALHPKGESPRSIEVRVFETETDTGAVSFHPKSWRFEGPTFATAWVGSSNLSHSALLRGIEWNLRLHRADNPAAYAELVTAFDALWAQSRPLTADWIAQYQQRIALRPQVLPDGEVSDDDTPRKLPPPHALQREALDALRDGRRDGHRSGLVVLATGLGKTLLAVHDVLQYGEEIGRAPRVLFLAHREELLTQAARWFRCVARETRQPLSLGFYAGSRDTLDTAVVLASVTKLALPAGIAALARERFDYAVVDEVHHADAASYRRILAALRCDFLLGLTATPDRTDGGDVLALFGGQLFYRADLGEAVRGGHLVPFEYHGLKDPTDYDPTWWRNGRFDIERLNVGLDTPERRDALWRAWHDHPGTRTLVFCASINHATRTREFLVEKGVRAETVFAKGGTLTRGEALRLLADGALDALVVVDLFNEGVDVPAIDRVVMLRPTESSVVFLQQLGRGLRKHPGKRALTVIDFVGNHRVFLWKLQTLLGLGGGSVDVRAMVLRGQKPVMPPGCILDVEVEAIDLLAKLLPAGRTSFERHYQQHLETYGRRPTAGEMVRAGMHLNTVRTPERGWFDFVEASGHLTDAERAAWHTYRAWFRDLETTGLTRSFKLIVLGVLLDGGVFFDGLSLDLLSDRSRERILRDPLLRREIEIASLDLTSVKAWRSYWKKNPIDAWCRSPWFVRKGDRFVTTLPRHPTEEAAFLAMTAELVDLRLTQYKAGHAHLVLRAVTTLPWYATLAAAAGTTDDNIHQTPNVSTVALPVKGDEGWFVVRATGSSMDGGRRPIRDGDWCVLRRSHNLAMSALRDRVVLVQTLDRDDGMRFQLKRLVQRDGVDWFVSDARTGPAFVATASTTVLARVESVVRPASLAPTVGTVMTASELATQFGWHEGEPRPRMDGHRVLWLSTDAAQEAIEDDGAGAHPGETAYVLRRTVDEDRWRYEGLARWEPDTARWHLVTP